MQARRSEIARVITVTVDDFSSKVGKKPEVGKSYNIEGSPISYKILSIDGGVLTINQEIEVGKIIPIDDSFFDYVSEVNDNKIILLLTVENQTRRESELGNITFYFDSDYIYATLTPNVGARISLPGLSAESARVLSYDDKILTLDYNKEYAGEAVILKLKILT